MKRACFLHVLIAFAFAAFSKVQIDSVPTLLSDYSKARKAEEKYEVLKAAITFTAESNAQALLAETASFIEVKDSSLFYFVRAEAFYYAEDAPSALLEYDKAIAWAEAQAKPDVILLSTLYGARAYVTEVTEGALPAIRFYLNGLNYAEQSAYDQEIADLNFSLARSYSLISDYPNALVHAKRAFDIDLAVNNKSSIATDLRLLSKFSLRNNNVEQALNYVDEALALVPRLDDQRLIASLYQRKAECLIEAQQTQEALEWIDKAISIEAGFPDSDRLAKTYFLQANAFFQQKSIDSCFNALIKAEQEARSNKQSNQIVSILSLQTEVFYFLNREEEFLQSASQTLEQAKGQNRLAVQASTYERLASFYVQKQAYKKALEFQQLGKNLQDSLTNQRAKAQLEVVSAKFDLQRINAMNEQLQQRVKSSQKTKILLAFISLLSLALMGIYLYNSNRKAQLKASLFEQQLLAKDRNIIEAELQAIRSQLNPHFMFNSLNSINEFILQRETDEASEFLVKFSKLMRLVLNHSKKQAVSIDKEVEAIRLYVELEALRFEDQLKYTIQIDPALEKEDGYLITPMVIQPFIENAIWHGLNHSKATKWLNIDFQKKGEYICCLVQDNGIGRQASAKINGRRNHKSQGHELLQNRFTLIEQLHNKKAFFEITDLQPQGTSVAIQIPILS